MTQTCKIYTIIQENGGWDEWSMAPIEIGMYESKRGAECRETQLIREQENLLNSKVSFLTQEEILEQQKKYYIENKEHITEQQKKYYIENKEHIAEKHKKYYKQIHTCDCGSKCRVDHKPRHERSKKHLDYLNITV